MKINKEILDAAKERKSIENIEAKVDSEETAEEIFEFMVIDTVEEEQEEHIIALDLESINEYKEQVLIDREDYDKEYEEYKQWCGLIEKMRLEFIELSTDINEIIKQLNDSIELQVNTLTPEQKSDVDNRAKGINIIGKMFNNTVEKNLGKVKVYDIIEKEELNVLEDVDITSEDIITEQLNKNYNSVSQMKKYKDSIIKDYFNFINSYILPINDGVLSGIQYIDAVENDEINRLVLPTYIKLKEKLEELLGGLGITEIKIEKFDQLDYAKIEVFDIEETDDEKLDETIHETIRTGYSYCEDIYNTGNDYIVRTVQVTVYKYKENNKVVDSFEI